MRQEERRRKILAVLLSADKAVSGSELSKETGVSRQIIVQDIGILRAEGYEILSTHDGYVVKVSKENERVFKVRHRSSETEDELSLIVRLGGVVEDVFVWHRVYGRIEAKLNIFSERQIEQFMQGIKSGKSRELMHITEGYHYHTVRADSESTLDRIERALDERGYAVPEP